MRSVWASSDSASCFTTGMGALLRLVFGSLTTLFPAERFTASSFPSKFSQHNPRISPLRNPGSAAVSTTVRAGSGSTERMDLISARLYA